MQQQLIRQMCSAHNDANTVDFFLGGGVVIVRLYFRHCKVQKDYKFTHYTPFPLSKPKKKLANHAKRKERERKKTYKKHKNLQGQL